MGEDKDVLAARVFAPPLQWMMQCLAGRSSHQELQVRLHMPQYLTISMFAHYFM